MATRIGLPNIDIIFKQKAVTAIQRSQRGVLCIIVQDDKQESGVTTFTYKRVTDIQSNTFNETNLTDIKRAFDVAVNKVIVVRASDAFDDGFEKELDKLKFNYICTNVAEKQQDLANYVRQYNSNVQGHRCVCVVANATTANSKYIINVKGSGGVTTDGETVTASAYCIRIASTLANLPMNRSLTYYVFSDLQSWDDTYLTEDITYDSLITSGYLVLINDDGEVKCGRAVNSLVSFTGTDTEDMQYIVIVDAMCMILEDIYTTFKDYYVGKYKNTLSNQRLFLSSVNAYFRTLVGEDVLDDAYDNHCEIDIEEQRNAWLAIGKTEAEDWTDNQVRQMPFRTTVFAAGDIKITNCIEDLHFVVALQ